MRTTKEHEDLARGVESVSAEVRATAAGVRERAMKGGHAQMWATRRERYGVSGNRGGVVADTLARTPEYQAGYQAGYRAGVKAATDARKPIGVVEEPR